MLAKSLKDLEIKITSLKITKRAYLISKIFLFFIVKTEKSPVIDKHVKKRTSGVEDVG